MTYAPEKHTVVYGIGGTGAKCLEALVYLTAAGIVTKPWRLRLVDQDRFNGNGQRVQTVLRTYRELCTGLRRAGLSSESRIFRTEIAGAGEVFRVLEDSKASLAQAFNVQEEPDLEASPDAALMHALFSPRERADRMINGFVGRPSIGCAAFLSPDASQAGAPLWQTVRADVEDVKADQVDQVLLFGSVFGGTGASGVPTLAREFRQQLVSTGGRARLGAALLMRYFDVDGGTGYGPVALGQMRAALDFYHGKLDPQLTDRPMLDALYLTGLYPELLVPAEHHGGGRRQVNPGLVPELVAALGGTHFMTTLPAREGRPVWLCARREAQKVSWEDLPWPAMAGRPDARGLFIDFARLLYAYTYGFHCAERFSELQHVDDLPCYFRFLDPEALRRKEYDGLAETLQQFSAKFLVWLGCLHRTRSRQPLAVELCGLSELVSDLDAPNDEDELFALAYQPGSFPSDNPLALGRVKDLFKGITQGDRDKGLHHVALRMGALRRDGSRGFGRFVGALYHAASQHA